VGTDDLSPEAVAQYMVNALNSAAEGCAWPDGIRGNACQLLVQDLGEFGAAMVACARANYWSPALAIERMWIERFEVLMGVVADDKFAKRYLDSVAMDADPVRPLAPRKKARAEDSVGATGRAAMFSADEVNSFRSTLLVLKDVASDWFVHPTAMGPLLSRSVRDGEQNPAESWGMLVALLSFGCVWAIAAASRCGIAAPLEMLRSLDGAAQVQEQLDVPWSNTLRQIQQDIAARVTFPS